MHDVVRELLSDAIPKLDGVDGEIIKIIQRLRLVAARNPPYVQIRLHPTKARLWAAHFEELLMLRHGTGDDG